MENPAPRSNLEFLEIIASSRAVRVNVEWFRAIYQIEVPNDKWHAHSNTEIHFVTQGELVFHFQDQQITVPAGNAILIPAKTTHRLENPLPQEYFSFVMNCQVQLLNEAPEAVFLQSAIHRPDFTTFSIDDRLMMLLEECVNEEMQHVCGFVSVIECDILLILMHIARVVTTWPPAQYPIKEHMDIVNCRIDQILAYIENHPTITLTAERLAGEVGLSVRQVQRIVRRQCDASISELIDRVCLQRAKNLLKVSTLSISSIASEMGFSSEQAFSRFFRRTEGDTPNNYRRGVAPLSRRHSRLLDESPSANEAEAR